MILFELFFTFFKIGALTFGGGYAMIPFVREQVLLHGWLTEEELLIQLRLFHQLSRLDSLRREKVLNVIYELLDAMGKSRW